MYSRTHMFCEDRSERSLSVRPPITNQQRSAMGATAICIRPAAGMSPIGWTSSQTKSPVTGETNTDATSNSNQNIVRERHSRRENYQDINSAEAQEVKQRRRTQPQAVDRVQKCCVVQAAIDILDVSAVRGTRRTRQRKIFREKSEEERGEREQ